MAAVRSSERDIADAALLAAGLASPGDVADTAGSAATAGAEGAAAGTGAEAAARAASLALRAFATHPLVGSLDAARSLAAALPTRDGIPAR